MNFDVFLDAKGLRCPQPILQAKRALTKMQSGEILKVLATDPAAQTDFEAFCRHTQNELIKNQLVGDGVTELWIKRR